MSNDLSQEPFEYRLMVACARAAWRYAERGEFISDDDLLDIANDLTISDLTVPDDGADHWADDRDTTDRDALIAGLEAWLTPDEPDLFVWVVQQGYDWEGQDVQGVFADRESAMIAATIDYPLYSIQTETETSVYLRADSDSGYVLVDRMKVGEWL